VAELYGHATITEAVALAQEAGARELVLFHHAPGRTDDELVALLAEVDAGDVAVSLAIEGAERCVGS